jgi:hypothetical protein
LILGLRDDIKPSTSLSQPPQGHFLNFIDIAIAYISYVKELHGHNVENITPQKKRTTQLMSPSSRSKNAQPDLLSSNTFRKRLMSPESKTSADQKIQLNSDIYLKETEALVKSAIKREKIKIKNAEVISVQSQIKKTKFDMEKEEKIAL